MKRTASLCTALWLASAACGTDDEGPNQQSATTSDSGMGVSTGSATTSDAGTSSELDANSTAEPQEAATAPTNTTQDASTPSQAPVKDAGMEQRPPLVLDVPKATMQCGGSACDTLTNVCCESWSRGSGFGSKQTCLTREKCHETYGRAGDQNRAIPHECDGKEDCSGGQVCCMYAAGMPLCEFADLGNCINKLIGPGGSGICVDNDKCKLGGTQFVAEGVPLGILACNDDSDCADRPGTRCQAEESNSVTTGKDVNAREHVKVCR